MAEKIVYKTVMALLALAAVPIAFFSSMIHIVGDITIGKTYVGEDISLYEIYNLFFSPHATFSGFGDFKLTDAVRTVLPALIASGVLLVCAILIGFAAAVVAIASDRKLPVMLLSAASFLCVIGMFIAFNRYFAAPFVDGTIPISELGIIESGILNTLFSALIQLELLKISSAGFLLAGVYGGAFLWSLAYILVELGEPKPQSKTKRA